MDNELLYLVAERVLGRDALSAFLKQKEEEDAGRADSNAGEGGSGDNKPGSGDSKPNNKQPK